MESEKRLHINQLVERCQLKEAEQLLLDEQQRSPQDDEICYILGNLYRKQSNWKESLQWYAQAIDLNPGSPALHAREMLLEIMNFYDKERYNV